MKFTSTYNDFLNLLLEEYLKLDASLYFTKECREFIQSLADNGDSIAQELVNNINTPEKTSDITWVDLTDKNDVVSFVQVNRIMRYRDSELGDPESKKQGEEPDQTPEKYLKYIKSWGVNALIGNHFHPLFKDKTKRTELNVGRFANKVLTKFGYQVDPVKLNKFVDNFKALFDFRKNKASQIEIVEGEEIRKWYLENNYYKPNYTLQNSCMRYSHCQEYLDIYVENSQVKLAILKSPDDKNKIIGRALIWTLENGETYLDRPYANNDEDVNLFKQWGRAKGWKVSGTYDDVIVKLDSCDFSYYPYMDTFKYLDTSTCTLHSSSEEFDKGNGDFIKLEETNGKYQPSNPGVYSDYYGEYIDRDSAVWAENEDSWISSDDAIYLEYNGEYVHRDCDYIGYSEYDGQYYYHDDLVESEHLNTYIYANDALQSYTNSKNEDYLPKDYLTKGLAMEVNINGDDLVVLTSAVIKNPFADEWLFKDGEIMVHKNKRGGQYISQKEAEENGYDLGSQLESVNVDDYLFLKSDNQQAPTKEDFFNMIKDYKNERMLSQADKIVRTKTSWAWGILNEWEQMDTDAKIGVIKLGIYLGYCQSEILDTGLPKSQNRAKIISNNKEKLSRLAPEELIEELSDGNKSFNSIERWVKMMDNYTNEIIDTGLESDRQLIVANYLFKHVN